MPKAWTKNKRVRNEYDRNRVRFLTQQFDRYENYWRPDIDRYTRNARMYWHVNFGMWPQAVVDKLREQGRRPPTLPIIPDKIETFVSAVLSNDFDIKFTPRTGRQTTLTNHVNEMYLSDKHYCDWDGSRIPTLLDANIGFGCERLTIIDEVDDFGNVGREHMNARHTYLDPGWKNNFVKDIRDYFFWDNKTPMQAIETYGTGSERLRILAEKEKIEGVDYGEHEGAVPRFRTFDEKWSGLHKFIEFHWVEKDERWYEYDLMNHCWFPDTGFKAGSDEDKQVKKDYVQEAGLSPTDISWRKQKRCKKKLQVIAPSIDAEMFIEGEADPKSSKNDDIIQTQNCNVYPLGLRYNGQFMSLVDRLYDINIAANKGEMNIQDVMQRSAKGAFFLDRALSGGDPEIEAQIEQAWNDAGARAWVEEGSTKELGPSGGMIKFPEQHISSDTFHQQDRYLDQSDRYSKVPTVMDARSEKSGEPAVKYRNKLEVAMMGQKYMMTFYERHEIDMARAWLRQGKRTYSGIQRTFNIPGTEGDMFDVNVRMKDEINGRTIVYDDISKLPEMNLTLVPSRKGVNIRATTREELWDHLQILNDPADRLLRTIVTGNLMEMSELSDETKEEVRKGVQLTKMDAALQLAVNIQTNMGQLSKANQALEMINQQTGGGQQAGLEPPVEQQMTFGEPTEEEVVAGTPAQRETLPTQGGI
jgi:hypothetical protein